jgi:hypothetical protein
MKRLWIVFACSLAAVSSLLFIGCEAESSADVQLTLEPRSITLHPGESAVFTVSGGYEYRWSLSTESLGTLNKRLGNQVIYTTSSSSTNAATQILTVESFITGASGNSPTNIISSNNMVTAVSVSATITQLP